jgi:flagellar hook-basal body complex protein FliE
MFDQISMVRTHQRHIGSINSPYAGSGQNILDLQKKVGAEGITQAGSFETAMLQALDKVSGAHQRASHLQQEALLNPDLVDVHDVTIAQAQANMSFNITRTILARLVQGWRDLINTR